MFISKICNYYIVQKKAIQVSIDKEKSIIILKYLEQSDRPENLALIMTTEGNTLDCPRNNSKPWPSLQKAQ